MIPLFILFLTGCGGFSPSGIIYTNIVTPLDVNLSQTPKGVNQCKEDIKYLNLRYVSLSWDSAAIGEIAEQNGIEQVYYADIETLSILGIWRQYKVHIYGK
jgi:hypothetical protein